MPLTGSRLETPSTVQDGGTRTEARRESALLKRGALENAFINSANFSSIATDDRGVIQVFNVGAQRMLGYAPGEIPNRLTPADIADPQEARDRALAFSAEFGRPIAAGFEAPAFKASFRYLTNPIRLSEFESVLNAALDLAAKPRALAAGATQ